MLTRAIAPGSVCGTGNGHEEAEAYEGDSVSPSIYDAEVGPFGAAARGATRLAGALWAAPAGVLGPGGAGGLPPSPAGGASGGGSGKGGRALTGKELLELARVKLSEGSLNERVTRFSRAIDVLRDESDLAGEAEACHHIARLYREQYQHARRGMNTALANEGGELCARYFGERSRLLEATKETGHLIEASRAASSQAEILIEIGEKVEARRAAERGVLLAIRYKGTIQGVDESHIQALDARVLLARAEAVEVRVLAELPYGCQQDLIPMARRVAGELKSVATHYSDSRKEYRMAAILFGDAAELLKSVSERGHYSDLGGEAREYFTLSVNAYAIGARSAKEASHKEWLLEMAFRAYVAADNPFLAAEMLADCAISVMNRMSSEAPASPLLLSAAWFHLRAGWALRAQYNAHRVASAWIEEAESLWRSVNDPATRDREIYRRSWEDAAVSAALALYILGSSQREDGALRLGSYATAYAMLQGVPDGARIRTRELHFIDHEMQEYGQEFVYPTNSLAGAAHLKSHLRQLLGDQTATLIDNMLTRISHRTSPARDVGRYITQNFGNLSEETLGAFIAELGKEAGPVSV